MTELSPLFRGDSREYALSFTDKDSAVIDITGWKVYFTLKKNQLKDDDSAVIKKDITVHEAPLEGKTKIVLAPLDTDNLKPGDYVYDIQIKKPSGDVITVAKGSMKIEADVTRRTD